MNDLDKLIEKYNTDIFYHPQNRILIDFQNNYIYKSGKVMPSRLNTIPRKFIIWLFLNSDSKISREEILDYLFPDRIDPSDSFGHLLKECKELLGENFIKSEKSDEDKRKKVYVLETGNWLPLKSINCESIKSLIDNFQVIDFRKNESETVIHFKNGETYKGEWNDGRSGEKGEITDSEGKTHKVIWDNGVYTVISETDNNTINKAEELTYTIVPGITENFQSRDEEIGKIKLYLKNRKTVVLLNGIGGIGKSMIARKIYLDYAEKSADGIEYIGWINYENSLAQSIKTAVSEKITGESDVVLLQQSRKLFNQYENKLLLIIDNANNLQEEETNWISGLNCKVLLTSRTEYDDFESVNISELSFDKCLDLYKKNANVSGNEQDESIKQILELISMHTLSVEIIAKTQKKSHLSADEILSKINSQGILLPENKIRYKGNETVFSCLSALFNITDLSDEEIHVLTLFSLLAPNLPLKFDTVIRWFSNEELDENCVINGLNTLTEYGWLIAGEKGIYIHPVPAEIVIKKQNPDYIFVEHMANELISETAHCVKASEKSKLLMHCSSIIKSIKHNEEEGYAKLLNRIGVAYKKIASYDIALEYLNASLKIIERIFGTDHEETASTYNNIATVYVNTGDYEKTLEYYNKALKIRENKLGINHQDTAKSYSNIGDLFDTLGKYDKALEYLKKAIEIKESVLGTESLSTAISYGMMGNVYRHKGEYDKAMLYFRKSKEVREKISDKSGTGLPYRRIGYIYMLKGEYDKALEYLTKAVDIDEKILGYKHNLTAMSYNAHADLYICLKDYDKAMEYANKSMEIRRDLFEEEHSTIANSYHTLAKIYAEQGECDKALEYYRKAYNIREKVLGTEHPNTAATYREIASLYHNQGKNKDALVLLKKAFVIYNNKLGFNHPDTQMIISIIIDVAKAVHEDGNELIEIWRKEELNDK